MSEQEGTSKTPGYKRRRLQGACDECRKRKIKCDSAKMSDNICSNCTAFRCECTHLLATTKKKRGPPIGKPRGTKSISTIVKSILSADTQFDLPDSQEAILQMLVDMASHVAALEEELAKYRSNGFTADEPQETEFQASGLMGSSSLGSTRSFPSDLHADTSVASRSDTVGGVSESFERLGLEHSRHFGASSSLTLLQTAMDMKERLPQDVMLPSSLSYRSLRRRRPEFWAIYPWQIPIDSHAPALVFPEESLTHDLINLYFLHHDRFVPVLHRPTFETSVSEGLHHRNRQFAYTLLAVCAVAARYSNDPRVFPEGSTQEFSAGWHWFRQIQLFRNSYISPPSIYELQLCIISILFLQGTSTPEACWILVSYGIRLAQDVGAHRRKAGGQESTVENELWKRAFWMLYVMDIYISAYSGRPRATSGDDLDLDFPIECDDEYWENPNPDLAFKQPLGRPATMTYCIVLLKLFDILSTAQRTLYSTRRSDIWTMMGMSNSECNQKILSELDTSLRNWIDSVPEHLKWDPNREDVDFFHQSVLLYVSYYWVQILVHKPFITPPGTTSDLSFHSLAICVNAARSAIHVMEVQQRRGFLPLPNVLVTLYNAAIVLVLNSWRGKHFKTSAATNSELIEVYKCIGMIRYYERRWQNSGTYSDVICEIIAISGLDQKPQLPEPSRKSSQPHSQTQDSAMAPSDSSVMYPIFADATSIPAENIDIDPLFNLPLHSNELGDLPLHESFDPFGDAARYSNIPMNGLEIPSLGLENLSSSSNTLPTELLDGHIDELIGGTLSAQDMQTFFGFLGFEDISSAYSEC